MTDFDKTIEEAKAVVLPYESWERLTEETAPAYAAFCVFRDLGFERNIRKAYEKAKNITVKSENQYSGWRNYASLFRWKERAEAFDRYTEKMKQAEFRKTIEAQGEKHRE